MPRPGCRLARDEGSYGALVFASHPSRRTTSSAEPRNARIPRQIRALPPSCDRQASSLSHISWRTAVADQLSDHMPGPGRTASNFSIRSRNSVARNNGTSRHARVVGTVTSRGMRYNAQHGVRRDAEVRAVPG